MEPYVMVIANSQDFREQLCDLLTGEGYAVALYATPVAAKADLDRLNPDLIVLDRLIDQERESLLHRRNVVVVDKPCSSHELLNVLDMALEDAHHGAKAFLSQPRYLQATAMH